MLRDGAGPQGKDLNSFDPIKKRLAEVLNLNKKVRILLERDPPEENLAFLYNELQQHEAVMDNIEEVLLQLMEEITTLSQQLQAILLEI